MKAGPSAADASGESASLSAHLGTVLTAFALAMVPVLFSYGGSHTTTFMAAEIRDPARNLPRGLILGICGVIALYLGMNLVCLSVLGVDRLAASASPASEVMRAAFGAPGAAMLSAGVAISALGFLSQATLTSPRVYYAMARDGLFFQGVGWVHPRTRVPIVAILLQGAFAIMIALQHTFLEILNYVMCVELIFLAVTALGLFRIRHRDAALSSTQTVSGPGHPWATILFATVNLILVANLFVQSPAQSIKVTGVALAGLPIYFLWRIIKKGQVHSLDIIHQDSERKPDMSVVHEPISET